MSQRTHDIEITSLLHQNDVITSFWRNNDVIITSCVRWDLSMSSPWFTVVSTGVHFSAGTWFGVLLYAEANTTPFSPSVTMAVWAPSSRNQRTAVWASSMVVTGWPVNNSAWAQENNFHWWHHLADHGVSNYWIRHSVSMSRQRTCYTTRILPQSAGLAMGVNLGLKFRRRPS